MGPPTASAGPRPADARDRGDETRVGVVLPIRSFEGAKERLAERLSGAARAELARDMATHVARAAAPLPLVVVSSAPEVRSWARDLDAAIVDDPGTGLDAAAAAGTDFLETRGFTRGVVVHADLPDAGPLDALAAPRDPTSVVLVPCHRDDGTNVCSVPLPRTFPFAYGPGSFRRHLAAARALGVVVEVVRRADLAFDVDVPEDYDRLSTRTEA